MLGLYVNVHGTLQPVAACLWNNWQAALSYTFQDSTRRVVTLLRQTFLYHPQTSQSTSPDLGVNLVNWDRNWTVWPSLQTTAQNIVGLWHLMMHCSCLWLSPKRKTRDLRWVKATGTESSALTKTHQDGCKSRHSGHVRYMLVICRWAWLRRNWKGSWIVKRSVTSWKSIC